MDEGESFGGCKAAILIGGRLLVLRRDPFPDIEWPDHWDLPGGARDPGETPWETLRREVCEETGLDMNRADLLWRMYRPTYEGRPPAWFFVATLPASMQYAIRLGEEGTAWMLVEPSKALDLTPMAPHLMQRLEAYAELVSHWGEAVEEGAWSPL